MVLLIILLLVLSIVGYLLIAPWYVEINTDRNLYRVRFHHLANGRLLAEDNSLIIEFRIIGWQRRFDLLGTSKAEKKTIHAERKKKSSMPFKKIWSVIKTFKVNRCEIIFDSGNMSFNGILFPVFEWLSYLTRRNIRVNFRSENKIVLEVENNLARMGWAFIKASFTNLKNKSL